VAAVADEFLGNTAKPFAFVRLIWYFGAFERLGSVAE
jgi:hypothetical protein